MHANIASATTPVLITGVAAEATTGTVCPVRQGQSILMNSNFGVQVRSNAKKSSDLKLIPDVQVSKMNFLKV